LSRLQSKERGISTHLRFLVRSGGNGLLQSGSPTPAERHDRCIHADAIRPCRSDSQCGPEGLDSISAFHRKFLEPSLNALTDWVPCPFQLRCDMIRRTMKPILCIVILLCAVLPALAQLPAPNADGVTAGHHIFR